MKDVVMTDAEINLTIAKSEYPEGICQNLTSELTGNTVTFISGVQGRNSADYVNNWADIGPIIEREGINLKHDTNHWEAYRYTGDPNPFWIYFAYADTPTKAAALCYLKMKA